MFTLNENLTRLVSSETPIIQNFRDPNFRSGLDPRTLVIHGIQTASVQMAVDIFMEKARSIHLVIGPNGKDIAQLVDFDKVAFHANEYDRTSLGITLVYPGRLIERSGVFFSKDRFDPSELILAQSVNDPNKARRWYPFYRQEQLDALLEIARLLGQTFSIKQILEGQSIRKEDLNSGPAFPINRFRQLFKGPDGTEELLETTSSPAHLFTQPGGNGQKILANPIPKGTPIIVTHDEGEWVLVEVMADLEGRRWSIGWMRANQIAAQPFKPVITNDHFLATESNRRIKFFPAHEKNFNPELDLDPRFVIIHFTTGTDMQSIIHTFQNPDEGVCTHLLVGRNGHVVQFVPLDKVAFHCGLSTWEGEQNLNRFAIGIEVDNAGYLRNTRKGFMRKDKFIPEDQVESARHWKEDIDKHWQKFSDEQVRVVKEIVLALKERYPSIQEIVGHDMVNLINRLDPGPFYPIGELREAVLGSPQPRITHYRTRPKECLIYQNIDNRPPQQVPHPDFGILPAKSRIKELDKHEPWSIVRVKGSSQAGLREKVGWVRSDSYQFIGNDPKDKVARTKLDQTFYKVIPAVQARLPPLELKTGPLPRGTHVRIQFQVGDWALVAPVLSVRKNENGRYEVQIPADKVKKKFLEGWVQCKHLKKVKSEP